jgi:hypothetical protein
VAFRRAPFSGLLTLAGSSPRGISASSEFSIDLVGLPRLNASPKRDAGSYGRLLPWGFGPHRDMTSARPLTAGTPTCPLRSALRVSHPPDGFLRASARDLVSCLSHVQGCTFRGLSPLRTTVLPFDSQNLHAVSSCRLSEQRTTHANPTGRDLEVVLRSEPRPPAPGVIPEPVALPSWCSASSGLSLLPHPSPRFRDASHLALRRRFLRADVVDCTTRVYSATGSVRLSQAARPS